MIRTPKSKKDDWVNVSIQDNGDYEFASYRTIGVFSGKGNLAVKDGKAMAQGEKGSVTVQLFTEKTKGENMLKAEGKGKDGIPIGPSCRRRSRARKNNGGQANGSGCVNSPESSTESARRSAQRRAVAIVYVLPAKRSCAGAPHGSCGVKLCRAFNAARSNSQVSKN